MRVEHVMKWLDEKPLKQNRQGELVIVANNLEFAVHDMFVHGGDVHVRIEPGNAETRAGVDELRQKYRDQINDLESENASLQETLDAIQTAVDDPLQNPHDCVTKIRELLDL